MSANEHQVGGKHYKTGYEHWDFVLDTDQDYLIGQVTKYLSRWTKKNGLQDLEKSIHFLDKKIETYFVGARYIPVYQQQFYLACLGLYATENKLSPLERDAMVLLLVTTSVDDLKSVREIIKNIIEIHKNPVPLTEENNHGERAEETDWYDGSIFNSFRF